jgi:hypothetical protein
LETRSIILALDFKQIRKFKVILLQYTNQFIGLFGQLGHKSIEEENFGTNYIWIIGEKDMEQKH